jgi:hypothetical protein
MAALSSSLLFSSEEGSNLLQMSRFPPGMGCIKKPLPPQYGGTQNPSSQIRRRTIRLQLEYQRFERYANVMELSDSSRVPCARSSHYHVCACFRPTVNTSGQSLRPPHFVVVLKAGTTSFFSCALDSQLFRVAMITLHTHP